MNEHERQGTVKEYVKDLRRYKSLAWSESVE